MDALPITERGGDRVATSEVAGVMHACGHDGHVAMTLGAAAVLASLRDSWRGRLRLCFQPAEEVAGGRPPHDRATARWAASTRCSASTSGRRCRSGRLASRRPDLRQRRRVRAHRARPRRPRRHAPHQHRPGGRGRAGGRSRCRPSSAARRRPSRRRWSPSAASRAARPSTSSPTRCACAAPCAPSTPTSASACCVASPRSRPRSRRRPERRRSSSAPRAARR